MTSSFPMADTSAMAPDAALAESRRFLKSTLDALSAHIAILDEHGIIIEVNAAWIRFARENDFNGGQHGLGDNYLKICGAAVGDFSAEALAMAKGIRAVMAGENDEFSMEYPCHSSRQQRWFIGRATRFTGEGPVRVVMAHENITQRKQAEDALRWKTGLFEAHVNTSIDGILVTDPQGRKILQNQQLSGLFNIPPTLAENDDHAKQLVWTANRTKNPEQFVEKAAYLCAHQNELSRDEIELKDGTVLDRYTSPLNGRDGTYYGRFWTFRDITKGKQAEKTLREKEHLLSESQRLGHIGSWFADLTGPFSWSEEMYRIFGVSPDAFIPTAESLFGLIQPDNRPAMQAWLAGCAAGAKPVEMEFRITRPDGLIRFIKGNSEAVYDVNHRLIHIAGTAQDITESKQAQAEREKLERMVAEHQANEESVRLALLHEQKSSQIKSRFVSMVSHEFRTPLSVINLAVELLKGYWERMTPAERTEQLKEIQGAIVRMTQMMTDFLVQGDCTSGTMECQPARVAVEDLCRRLIAEVPSYSNSPRTIELVVTPPIGEVFLDEKILRHILDNLLSNAVKYSSAGQPVKLEVKRIAGTTQPNGDTDAFSETHLEFKVSDSGIGIPTEDIAMLYQTFHRAANVGNRPGTGMGLAIVKRFVDLHRGTIRFESKEGKGTTVWVHLPIAPPASRTES